MPKCLHENTRPHQEDWEDEFGATIVDHWCECLDCGEMFTPSEWDREQESIEAERERVDREHQDDIKFHIYNEGRAA
jgi:hypothetical protein